MKKVNSNSMNKGLFLMIILIASCFSISCTCENSNSILGEYDDNEVVVVGKVLEKRNYYYLRDTTGSKIAFYTNNQLMKNFGNSFESYLHSGTYTERYLIDYIVRVERKFKCKKSIDTLIIRTGEGDHDCGYRFFVGYTYLIFATSNLWYINDKINSPNSSTNENVYMTSLCNYNAEVHSAKKVIAEIEKYKPVISEEFDGHKWEAPYTLPIPKDWGLERFQIPINFAPQIDYKGVEDIRFTPGWAKVKSDEYWSYAFLWYLAGKIKLDSKVIESNLKDYYTGLVSTNGSKIPKEKLIPVTVSFKERNTTKGDIKTYTGTIKMTDYMQQKPITLYCKVHWKSCTGENKTFIFFELSPQAFRHNVWLSLDQLWSDFKCKD